MTLRGRLGWVWLMLLVGGLLVPVRAAVAQDDVEYEIFIAGRYCETDPGGQHDPTCLPANDVLITVTGPDGTSYGSCTLTGPDPDAAGSLGGCFVTVPFDTTLTVTEDTSTLRPGYVPTENPQTVTTPARSESGERGIAALFDNVLQTEPPPAPDDNETAQSPTDADQLSGRPVTVVAGTCAEPGSPVAELGDAVPPSGDRLGSPDAVIAASGYGTIPLALDALLADEHAVLVRSVSPEGATVACGEIGAVADDDGVTVIGLRAVDGSGVVGIAYLAQGASDESLTEASYFVVEGLEESNG